MVQVFDRGRADLPDPREVPTEPDAAAPVVPARSGTAGLLSARWVVAAVIAAGISAVLYALWWTGTADIAAPDIPGLPDEGALTRVGLPIAEFVSELAGVAVAGLLFVRCLMPNQGSGPGRRHLSRMAARWGVVWSASTALWIVFTVSELVGTPVSGLPAQFDVVVRSLDTSRVLAEVATLWVALLVAMFATRATGTIAGAVLAVAAVGALLPSALSGHASHHNSAIFATIALGVHIVAAAIWVGGLLALIVHLRPFPDQLSATVRRFSAAALICAAAVGVSGVLVSLTMLDGLQALFGTSRGELILAKTAALIGLCAIGYQHRNKTVDAAGSGRLGPLLRLGAGELALMGATIGVAVVLSTTG